MKKYSQKYAGLSSEREFDDFVRKNSVYEQEIKEKYQHYLDIVNNMEREVKEVKHHLSAKLSKINEL